MKTISSEAYIAFDGTKFLDACLEYEQDEMLRPFCDRMASAIHLNQSHGGMIVSFRQVTSMELRTYLRDNRKELLEILQGMTP